MDPTGGAPESSPSPHETTAVLLTRARAGDGRSRERLFARCLPVLRRWAHHRLPARVRDTGDTDDLVQDVLLRAFRRLDTFEHRGEGAFLAYLRQILLNAIRDQVRRAGQGRTSVPLDDSIADHSPSAIEQAIGGEQLERFERAVDRLPEEQRQAVILRIEFGYSNARIAEAMDRPSPDAARMLVTRALANLAKALQGG
jgi:RNA polymerase sigma factor (sigma-70 family)